jgi:hypothetical protein
MGDGPCWLTYSKDCRPQHYPNPKASESPDSQGGAPAFDCETESPAPWAHGMVAAEWISHAQLPIRVSFCIVPPPDV